ncbi:MULTISPECIES: SIR2 family protein [unclassified Rathayibacter]|uniref:SIR2 family protein n=1 Tax=unclassified Rathayibacter TaxID=2609250 RepID=UPI0010447357|nr:MULTISPECIES: SIR2 family protein [unclassified Rathayibacter]TCL85990.1 SIR2-like protein [Rathayibacter sp. PhB192]TCM31811.1 SIR2-like protein [Rathayibacter sp. PhB179]
MADEGMDSLDDLAVLLGASKTLPVLFVGSGLSRRYLGAPDWDGLVEYAASLTEYPLDFYSSRIPASTGREDRLPQISSQVAEQFHSEWWTSAKYVDAREGNQRPLPGKGDPLKLMLAHHIGEIAILDDVSLAQEREKLARAKVHSIITTNYDELLENAFPDYKVFVGQQDVLFAAPQYVGEIYKIHGSISDSRSMVFTGEDYDEYRRKNPYLIAKIMTLFVEHPVIFMGYSLRDPHILELLATLVSCLSEDQLDTFNKRLIFVGRASKTRVKGLSNSSITVPGYTFGVQEFGIDDFGGVFEVLADLPEHYPVKLLRNLAERVTQMAYSDASSERIHVLPLQEGEDANDVEVVVGVGAFERLGIKGYSAYSRTELFLDMLAGADDHNVEHMRDHLLPHCFRNAKFSPIFYARYLAGIHQVSFEEDRLPTRAQALLSGATSVAPYPGRRPPHWETMGFLELLADYPELAENLAAGCAYSADDVIGLGLYLWPRFVDNRSPTTVLAKAGAKFDRLVYGNDFDGDRENLRKRVREELGQPRY